jgi:signal transduction histidine kinase
VLEPPAQRPGPLEQLEELAGRWPLGAKVGSSFLVFALYSVGAAMSYEFVIPPSQTAVFWLPSGMTFALFARARRVPSFWPGWLLALFLGELVVVHAHGIPWAVAAAWGMVNIALAVAIALLSRRFLVDPFAFRALRDIGAFLGVTAVAVVPGSLVAAAAAVLGLGAPSFVGVAVTWAVSDALGILLFAPVLLSWSASHPKPRGRVLEAAALLLALTVSSCAVFYRSEASSLERSLPSLLLLYVAWGSIRFGPRMTTLGLFIIDVIEVMATGRGRGPFATSGLNPADQLLNLQLLVATIGLLMLLLAAAIEEQRAARAASEEAHEFIIQTEKIMSLGGLAAGIAHEINNPLGIISQSAQNIERRMQPTLPANARVAEELGLDLELLQAYVKRREIDGFLGAVREAVARASRIVGNMLQFSRRPEAKLAPASLAALVDDAIELAANDYDLKKGYDFRNVAIERDYDPQLPEVPVVRVEIEQVVLNLLKNAAHAMCDNGPDRKPVIRIQLRREGDYAIVTVEDNGTGMQESVRRRVFEPFFTTKPPNMGTGLGMSVSFTIITKNHRGWMSVESEPGRGARFVVKLPLEADQEHV